MKRSAFIYLCLIASIAVGAIGCGGDDGVAPNGGTPSQTWARSDGGVRMDFGRAVTSDASGNIIVTGEFQGQATFGGSVMLSSAGFTDLFVAKYNSTGAIQWAKSAGGTTIGGDHGWGVATDAAGDIYVTGYYSGTADFDGLSITSTGGDDVFLAKYNSAGVIQWVFTMGGPGPDRARAVSVDGSGNVYVAGRFQGTGTFGGTMLTSAGDDDIFISSFNGNGGFRWALAEGGTGTDRAWGVTTDGANSVFVTGLFSGTATFSGNQITSTGGEDIFVAHYSSTGALQWVQGAGGLTDDLGWDVAADATGNVFVSGFYADSASFAGNDVTSNGANDIFVARYNVLGNFIWVRSAGGTSNDQGVGVALDGASNVLVTGFFATSATFGSVTINGVNDEAFFAKYDATGNLTWALSGGGSGDDLGIDITADASGLWTATGWYEASATFGGATLTSAGAEDVFVVKSGSNGF